GALAQPQPGASGRISDIRVSGATIRLVFSVPGLAPGATVDPGTVGVRLNGKSVPATAASAATGTLRRTAVLVLDTSGSMRGAGIAGAKAAALAFLAAVPADVGVGLVAFADQPRVVVAPTARRAAVRNAVAALTPSGETSLYDAVLLGVRTVGTTGARSLLVLSDGGDTTSVATASQAVQAVAASGVSIDAVAFRTSESVSGVLTQIATAAHGRVVGATSAADIGQAFTATAREISNQVLVTATLPPNAPSGQVTIDVSARVGEATVADSAVTLLSAATIAPTRAAGPVPVAAKSTALSSHLALGAALLLLFLGIAGALAVAIASMTNRESGRVRRRLSGYGATPRRPTSTEPSALGESAVARSAVEFADRVVRSRGLETRITEQLETAGLPLRAAEWLLIQVGTPIGLAVLLLLLSGGAPGTALLGLVVGAGAPLAFLRIKASRREGAFLAQLPDTLQLVAGSLSAGYSFPQAIDTVVREGAQPIAGEFAKAIVESRLGVPMEDALSSIALRMRSEDFSWVVMAVRIQREVGGNLAEVLTNVAATMRERERLRRQVKVLSAEGRLSAWILGLLPVLFAGYLVTVRPGYLSPLFTDPMGIVMIGGMTIALAVGAFWLRKVVRVDV
ncbi:MAG: type II secretion system F family protein, partial [Mycobacteriales bacterium]